VLSAMAPDRDHRSGAAAALVEAHRQTEWWHFAKGRARLMATSRVQRCVSGWHYRSMIEVQHGAPRKNIMVGNIFAIIALDLKDRSVMFGRDDAHRNIREQIAHD
jgi:hypothetical protein